jgi:hypothetical protein
MRVVSGRRSLVSGENARAAPRRDEDVLAWDDATTVSPMRDFDVVSGELGESSAPDEVSRPDIDADTVLDDRSIDEILNLALGTDERPMHMQVGTSMPPAAVAHRPVAPVTVPPPFAPAPYPVQYPAAMPVAAAPSESFPLQYPHTGPFHYPDLSHSGPFHYPDLSRPFPLESRGRSAALRWGIPALALLVVAAGGIAIGKVLFTGGDRAESTSTAAAPAAAPTRPSAPAAEPAPLPAPAAPAAVTNSIPASLAEKPSAISAEIATLVHPPRIAVAAPARGTVTQAFLARARRVRAGEKLFEITSKSSGGARRRELAAKVKELERLAKEDPVYEDFLARARQERDRVRVRTDKVVVTARKGGLYQPMVAVGDQVNLQGALASEADSAVWVAQVRLRPGQRPGTDWSCSLTSDPDGATRAACAILQVVDAADGVEVTVRVAARDAPWLARGADGQRLLFESPAAPE